MPTRSWRRSRRPRVAGWRRCWRGWGRGSSGTPTAASSPTGPATPRPCSTPRSPTCARPSRHADDGETDAKRLHSLAAAIVAGLAATKGAAATNVDDRIEPLKTLVGLGRRLNEDRVELLTQRFATVDELEAADEDALYDALRTNARTAEVLFDFFHSDGGRATITELRSLGVVMTDTAKKPAGGGPLAGMSVVVTGTLPTLGRTELEDRVVALGGKPSSAVSKKTTFVVAGDNAGSKLDKAKALGVEVIDEAEFLKRYPA